MRDENIPEMFNSETNQWINSIVQKNNQFMYSEDALTIPASERNYTQVALQSKLAYMDNANNIYLEKNKQYTDTTWKKFIKNSRIKIKGSGKKSIRQMIKDLYFESETFRRLFNYNQSRNKTLEIIYPSNNTHHVPNNYENAPNYHEVHLQEIPIANELGIHSVLSHELVHAFAVLDDYPRHKRFLLNPTDRNIFKETFPGPTELVNHKISEEMEMNNIGIVYTLRPYGDKGRLYNAPHVR